MGGKLKKTRRSRSDIKRRVNSKNIIENLRVVLKIGRFQGIRLQKEVYYQKDRRSPAVQPRIEDPSANDFRVGEKGKDTEYIY